MESYYAKFFFALRTILDRVQISGVTYLQIVYLNRIRSLTNPDTSSFVDIASIVTFNIQLNFFSNKIVGFF